MRPGRALTQAIQKVIKKTSETKYVRETILDSMATGYVNFNSYIGTSADWYRAIPQIGAGVTSAQKIGKVVMPGRCTLHLNFKFTSTEYNTRDIMVVLYVVSSVTQKYYLNSGVNNSMSAAFNAFLDPGDGVNDASFAGNWLSSTLKINRDAFHLQKKRLIHLDRSSGVSQGAGVVGQYDGHGLGQYAPNSKIAHRLSIPIKLPKKLTYDQNSNTVPTNAAVWFSVGYYYLNGAPGDNTSGILQVDASTEITYKDE